LDYSSYSNYENCSEKIPETSQQYRWFMEIRISAGNGIFRVFCFFDKGNLIILLTGFQKKKPENT